MTRSEIRRKAISEMEKRKLNAELEADRREREISEKLPQIGEIKRMLAQTVSELSKLIIMRTGNYKENFAKIKENNIQCQQMIKRILKENGYPEDHLEVHYRCDHCSDTGFTDNGMCDCLKRLISRIAAQELNRTANMPDADFAHFSLDYYRGVNIEGVDCYSKMSDNLDFCLSYANSFSENSKSILMLGKTGVGKTHLSMSIAKKITENGFNVIYGSAVNILRSIEKEHFGRSDEDSDTFLSLCECDLLILDDLGSEHHTAFYESALYNIINTRINSGKPMIISSNMTLDELLKTYNERIVSRIAGYYEVLFFVGKDIRQIKRLQK